MSEKGQARTYRVRGCDRGLRGVRGRHTPPSTISLGTGPNLAFLSANKQACHLRQISMRLGEVCDAVLSHCSSRFAVTGHLVAATLFDSSSFPNFEQCLPTKAVESAAASFPFLDEMKLHSELSVIYSRLEFRQCCGAPTSY